MKILVTGKTGQVGYELERSLQGLGEIIALDRSQMDLSDLIQVRNVIREIKPDLIINPAAYTAVDKAETEVELAMRVNGEAPGLMAEEAKKLGAAIIHYSTDYVFDGTKTGPYVENDQPCPINVYGASKLAGEQAIQAAGVPHLILRTSWVYGMRGKNFLLTVLRLAQDRNELRIVGDQHGAPTWCRTIADTSAHIVAQAAGARHAQDWWQEKGGLYHLTAQGQTTWAGFTEAILANAKLSKKPIVTAITTEEYPLPAKRPGNSVISCEKLISTFCGLPAWEHALELCQD
jgi:dTDP-4-dehydrorhamnose reductase